MSYVDARQVASRGRLAAWAPLLFVYSAWRWIPFSQRVGDRSRVASFESRGNSEGLAFCNSRLATRNSQLILLNAHLGRGTP